MGAGASSTSSAHNVPIILAKMKDPVNKRKKDKVRGLKLITKIADKGPDFRKTMVDKYNILPVLLAYNKREGMVGSAAMNAVAVLAKDTHLFGTKILDLFELDIIDALSFDDINLWKDLSSKQSWALITLQRLIMTKESADRVTANGIIGVIKPLLDFDTSIADMTVMDTIIVITRLFIMNDATSTNNAEPESNNSIILPDPSPVMLDLIIDCIDCIASGTDGTKAKLGRYPLNMLIETLYVLCKNINSLVGRLINDHFVIIRVLMNVLKNFIEGNEGNQGGGGKDDHKSVLYSIQFLDLLLSDELENDSELGVRLQSYGLGGCLEEIINREAPPESCLLLRLKHWNSRLPILPRPASTLKRGYISHGSCVVVHPPVEKARRKKKQFLSSEVATAHEYYKMYGEGEDKGFLKIESEDHCFVAVNSSDEDSKQAAKSLFGKLPQTDQFGSSLILSGGISARASRAALLSPSLDRRDGVKDVFDLPSDEEDEEDMEQNDFPFDVMPKAHIGYKHILLSFAKGCENERNIHIMASTLRGLGFRVYCRDGSIGEKLDSRQEEAMDSAPLIAICCSKKYHSTCREEAAYARILQNWGKANLLFVMMNDNYHTESHPFRIGGWLGNMLNVGGATWFPAWTAFQANGAAKEIASVAQRVLDGKILRSITRGTH